MPTRKPGPVPPSSTRLRGNAFESTVDDALERGARLVFSAPLPPGLRESGSFFPLTLLREVPGDAFDAYTERRSLHLGE